MELEEAGFNDKIETIEVGGENLGEVVLSNISDEELHSIENIINSIGAYQVLLRNKYTLDVNPQAFDAIVSQTKKADYRTNNDYEDFDYSQIKEGDEIKFINNQTREEALTLVKKVSHYDSAHELYTNEGLDNSSSRPSSIEVAVERIQKFSGYTKGIEKYGIWAIHFDLIKNK